jgi:2-amino-4-hydroxy-6-hydroxymethyldihydropteridine diphosphokinase
MAAASALDEPPLRLVRLSPVIASAPVGPSLRRYANAAALVETDLPPPALLTHLKRIERGFGRRGGRRWGTRVLDLDIILWSGGAWRERRLTVPHRAFATRAFVLVPLATITPLWRNAISGHSVRQHLARLRKAKPVDPPANAL